MPRKATPSLKDPDLYEELRKEGNSKQKWARISNAAAARGRSAVGRKGGKSGDYEDWPVGPAAQAREGTRHLRTLGQAQVRAHQHAARPLKGTT